MNSTRFVLFALAASAVTLPPRPSDAQGPQSPPPAQAAVLPQGNADPGEGSEEATEERNWTHWRGPRMNGHAYQSGLVDSWTPAGENLLWRKEEYASRGTPVAMNGKLYLVTRSHPETTSEGESTICIDAKTGELIWESVHNVFLSDAPAERVSWTSPVLDPESNRVYVMGINGVFQCLNADNGEIVWEHSMMEEYGMISPYGGRTNLPTVFEDLVIVSAVMTGWGDTAPPAHRYVAFDKETGMAAWMFSSKPRPEDTTYSTPVYTVFNGQAALVVGAADGAVYALQPRTGKVIWKYQASPRGINTTPLVDENGIVYCGHGEQNASDRTVLGAMFAFDGTKHTGEIAEDQLLWKRERLTVSRCAPLKIDDRIYVVDDGGELLVLDAATGKDIFTKKLGRIQFGSLMEAGGKIYIAEQTGRCYVFKPTEEGVEEISRTRMNDSGEVFGSPIAYEGRIYIATNTALYCIGNEESEVQYEPLPPLPQETPLAQDKQISHIQLAPVELMLRPGRKVAMQVRGYNSRGQFVKLIEDAQITVEGGGQVADGTFIAPETEQNVACFLTAKAGELTSTARARVLPDLPLTADFNDGQVPLTWIGAAYRHKPAEHEGEKVLVKVATIPKGTRSQAWFSRPSFKDYTVQADFYATDRRGDATTDRLPDMGLIAQRYTLDMKGNQELQIRSWTPRLELRFAKTIKFEWKPKTWYTMKFQSDSQGEATTLRGKVWPRGTDEPAEWQIEATDKLGNHNGSPGMFGNSTDAEFYIDNVSVHPNE